MHATNIIAVGNQSKQAKKAVILLHGRGGTAKDILTLSDHLHISDYALFAPEATNNSWYPQSFLAVQQQNEPGLSSALAIIKNLVATINKNGIATEQIYLVGFSQGACLTLEFVARNAARYGGVVAFTGGLIGDTITEMNYHGDFLHTPIFIGSSDPDPHVPVARVNASTQILQHMGALVTKKIYTNMGHTINADEIEQANKLIFSTS